MKVTIVRGRATDAAVYKLAKALGENGYYVSLLIWDRQNTLKNKDGDNYNICKFNLKAPSDKLTGLLYLPLWWAYELIFLLKNKCDVIHACDLETLMPAILAKLLRRVKLCYIIYDFYANNLPDGRFSIIRRSIRSIVASVEKTGIRFAEVLFLVDETRYEEVKGAKINRLVYLYNSPAANFEVISMQELKVGVEMIIFYAGLINEQRGLEYIINAVEELDNVRLILAGPYPDKRTDKELVDTAVRRCERIVHIGWLTSYDDIIQKTLSADLLFRFSDPKHPKTKYESPNKLFEAMMCGKPIIVTDGSAMANIVRAENCGLVVPYGDLHALKEAITSLEDGNLRQQMGNNGRKAYEQKYSWNIMQARLLDAYAHL